MCAPLPDAADATAAATPDFTSPNKLEDVGLRENVAVDDDFVGALGFSDPHTSHTGLDSEFRKVQPGHTHVDASATMPTVDAGPACVTGRVVGVLHILHEVKNGGLIIVHT